MNKKFLSLLMAGILCFSLYSCGSSKTETAGDSQSAETNQAVSSAAETNQASGSDETVYTDIAADRKNDDYDSLEKEAGTLLEQYYTGIAEESHDKCFGAFPDFYKKAIEDESKSYGETNEEFMQYINESIKEGYGDDYTVYAEITAILQLTDESLSSLEEIINKSFSVNIKLEDAYSVYFNQNASGSKDRSCDECEYKMIIIDGKYYLYDDYFEVYEDETAVSEENN